MSFKEIIRPYVPSFLMDCWYRKDAYGPAVRVLNELDRVRRVLRKGPVTINFQVNNICNSRCSMCNVWRCADDNHISPRTFTKILQADFFQGVRHVGITGGEPTLVENLSEYFRACAQSLPRLVGVSLITNSINSEAVVAQCFNLKKISLEYGLSYSVMLSLDGVGDVHDINRGIAGSFDNVLTVMERLDRLNIPFETSSTITKNNVWHLDELLAFLQKRNVHGRFRVAEFIDRLNNNDRVDVVRNFDLDEQYQLKLFFFKLINEYESNPSVRNTYRNIVYMLDGNERQIGCPYQCGDAVNIDCTGGLAICAPKGSVIACLPQDDAREALCQNSDQLKALKKTHCRNCIHDYHSRPLQTFVSRLALESKWRKYFTIDSFFSNRRNPPQVPASSREDNLVYIVGWYGTETVGDKAILGGVVDFYKSQFPNARFAIASMYPFITERTLIELGLEADVVPVYCEDFFVYASIASYVVAGGGPLMELEDLSVILWAFHVGKMRGAHTHICGCGIGPLYTDKKRKAVAEIIKLADSVHLRDQASVSSANELEPQTDALVVDDPSIRFITPYIAKRQTKKPELACFLRELTFEYRGEVCQGDFQDYKQNVEAGLALNIKNLCKQKQIVPRFYPMHNFCVGKDDRDFAYEFCGRYFVDVEHSVYGGLSTVDSVVDAMLSSTFCLAMRFHSVVFAYTLSVDFLAIDYTSGGKIFNFLSERGQGETLITLESLKNSSMAMTDLISSKLNYSTHPST